MRLIFNLLPVVLFSFLLLLFAGWNWMDWKLTTVLPYAIVAIAAFITSLVWRITQRSGLRKTGAVLFIVTLLMGLLFLIGIFSIVWLWIPMIIAVFASIHLYLFDIAAGAGLFRGVSRFVLVLPIALNVIFTFGFFCLGGNLQLVWIGFFLSVLFALSGNLFGYRAGK